MVARFNAIKAHAASDASAGPSVASMAPIKEVVENEYDNRLVPVAKGQLEEVDNVDEKQQQTADVEKPKQESAIECEEKSEPHPQPAPVMIKTVPNAAPPSPEPAPRVDLTVKVPTTPSTPTKSTLSQGTPRSRARATSIAEAKKKLAAARKISSSPGASRDKTVMGGIVNKMEDEERDKTRKERRESYENKLRQTIERVHGDAEAQARVGDCMEYKGSPSVPLRSLKASKIRARSPRFADEHKSRLMAPAEDEKKRLSDGLGDEEVQSRERWSDEFGRGVGASRLSDEFDGGRLSYGSARSHGTNGDESNAQKVTIAPRLSSSARTVSDELNALRLSDEFGMARTGTPERAVTIETSTESIRSAGDKTWQEKAKLAAKARQHRKWQHSSTPPKAAKDEVKPMTSDDSQDEDQEVNAYTWIKTKAEKFRQLQMEVKNAAEGNERGSDAYGRSEREQAAERDEYQPTDALDTYETEGPQEKGTFHMKMMAAKTSPSPSKKPQLTEHFMKESTAKIRHQSLPQPAVIISVSESLAKTSTGKSASRSSTLSGYKTLVPSRSDASKHSEPSLTQLTVSTSDVASFARESFSPKLAGEAFLSESKETDGQQLPNHFEDDDFQSNFDWAMDAFSPTSWPGGQSTSEDSKWDNVVPDTPNSLAAPPSLEEKRGWDLHANAQTVVESGGQEEEQQAKAPKKKMVEWDSWGQTGFDDEQFEEEQRDDVGHEEARAEAEARVTELEDHGGKFHVGDCSVQYEGFDSLRQEYHVSSPDVMSKCSEGTIGSVTEFDLISLFEVSVSDSFADVISKKDSFPACDAKENDASAASWGSDKVLKETDDSTNFNSAFPSLRSGAAIDASTLFGDFGHGVQWGEWYKRVK